MSNRQWQQLIDVVNGKRVDPPPAGFIIDSPWLPGWAGISTLDYFTSDECWFEANQKKIWNDRSCDCKSRHKPIMLMRQGGA